MTSDAGLILVRELDERLGLEAIIAAHLRDSRHGLNTQFRLPDLLRQSVYSRLSGLRRPQRRAASLDRSHVPPDWLADAVGPERGADLDVAPGSRPSC